MSYYERKAAVHLDGSPIFKTAEDEAVERSVADELERCWGVQIHIFGKLSAIDWWAERHGRIVGLLELKRRSVAAQDTNHCWLNVRKWLALTLGEVGMGVPSIFVMKFLDRTLWIPVNKIDARAIRIGGCKRQVKACSDIEPVIEIPTGDMTVLR